VGRRSDVFLRVLEEARSRRGVALMGICNVTPDSFSDGGRHFTPADARARVDELLAEGADIVDIGGESTRPGATPLPAKEQLARVLEVVRYAAQRGCVSIDTTSAEVAAACLDAGASVVNDVSCLRDPALAQACAANGAALVLMHSRGTQAEMKGFSEYPEDAYGDDVVGAVLAEWRSAAARAIALGVDAAALALDPGLGFAKSAKQSMQIMRELRRLCDAHPRVLVGASRKSFLKLVAPSATPEQRLGASIAAALEARRAGASVVRVHDVRETRQALDFESLCNNPDGRCPSRPPHGRT